MTVSKIDRFLGIEVYLTKTPGTGGFIRESVDDFVVEEILVDGSRAKINGSSEKPVLGATRHKKKFLLAVLVKRNWDTIITIRNIARQLGIGSAKIHIAGIKDAKAITAQHITIENAIVEDLSAIDIKDVGIWPVGYLRNEMSTFYLLGNSFRIKIRGIENKKTQIIDNMNQTIKELESIGGAPNYFGHQRFGTKRPITHLVGKAIVKGDFREAAILFLANPSPHEHPESRHAREELQSGLDFERAHRVFPKQLRFERLMLNHLAEKPHDFIGAFRRIPFKLRSLFVQAYQSYLFNLFLSKRINNGLLLNRIESGDFVMNIERSGIPMPRTGKVVDQSTLEEIKRAVEIGRMRIALPLIGFRQKPSHGKMGEIERQILENEKVKPEDFKIEALPEISARGELRSIITPAIEIAVDRIDENTDRRGQRQAELSFTLLRGSYATVILREIMKPANPIKAGF